MKNHNNIHPAYSCLRALLALALLLALVGCVPMSVRHESSIPDTPAEQDWGPLPTPVAFIVHVSSEKQNANRKFGKNADLEFAREAEAWRTVLSGYAEQAHIQIAETPASAPTAEFQAFCRTHPVVEIRHDFTNPPPSIWSYFNLAAVVLLSSARSSTWPLSDEMDARYTLTFPAQDRGSKARRARRGKTDPSAQNVSSSNAGASGQPAAPLSHPYSRRLELAPWFFLPFGDEYTIFMPNLWPSCLVGTRCEVIEFAHFDYTNWRVDEKRRLVALILNEIRPRLAEYAQHTAHEQPQ